MNREFLMLAQTFDPEKHAIEGWYASEKLDGQRCFWDGGVSRGRPTMEVPWANLDRKVKPVSSGLWSRYGNVITAPAHFLDRLPVSIFLDGELYSGNLQDLRSIVAKDIPNEEDWKEVQYLVFDTPGNDVFMTGRINNPNFEKIIDYETCNRYANSFERRNAAAMHTLPYLMDTYKSDPVVKGHTQIQLPKIESEARDMAYEMLDKIVAAGGEGLMLRNDKSIWFPKRGPTLLRMKPMHEGDGVIVGYVYGTRANKGMLGALRLEWEGKRFDVGTGFDKPERFITDPEIRALAWNDPGGFTTKNIHQQYPLGGIVEFKYTSLTNDGVPREARFSKMKEIE